MVSVVSKAVVFRLWCSTENDQGYHRRLGSKWAYCRPDCPSDEKETCRRRSDKSGKEATLEAHFIAQEKPTFDYVEYEENNWGYI